MRQHARGQWGVLLSTAFLIASSSGCAKILGFEDGIAIDADGSGGNGGVAQAGGGGAGAGAGAGGVGGGGSGGAPMGRIVWWRFDEGSGQTATDSASGHDGTLNGSGWSTETAPIGGGSNSIYFDGVDDYVEVPHAAALNWDGTSRTIEVWTKVTLPGPQHYVATKQAGNPPVGWELTVVADGRVRARVYDGVDAVGLTVTSTATVGDDAWHHIAWAFDASIPEITLYVDGIVEQTSGVPTSYLDVPNLASLNIGGGPFNSVGGLLDELTIFNYARTEREIQMAAGL